MDIGQTITLGIGTPSTIGGFITFGLGSAEVIITPTPSSRIYTVAGETRQNTIAADNRAYIVAAESRVVEVD